VPTVFTHAYFALTLRAYYPRDAHPVRLAILGMACSAVPDLDTVGYWYGVPYEHVCGHRGITHSLTFAVVLGALAASLAFRDAKLFSKAHYARLRYLSIATLSHGVLDMLTHGGRGVAFLAPFTTTRYSLPWQPIAAAPMSIRGFFTAYGFELLLTEMLWIWAPATVVALVVLLVRWRRTPPASPG